MDRYAAIGIDHVQLALQTADPVGYTAQLGERVIPRLGDIRT